MIITFIVIIIIIIIINNIIIILIIIITYIVYFDCIDLDLNFTLVYSLHSVYIVCT